jgi:hypothetical protein
MGGSSDPDEKRSRRVVEDKRPVRRAVVKERVGGKGRVIVATFVAVVCGIGFVPSFVVGRAVQIRLDAVAVVGTALPIGCLACPLPTAGRFTRFSTSTTGTTTSRGDTDTAAFGFCRVVSAMHGFPAKCCGAATATDDFR